MRLLLLLGSASAYLPIDDFPWLTELQSPEVLKELQNVADRGAGFAPDWQRLTSPDAAPDSWSALTLLNKGVVDDDGCERAPHTCKVLGGLEDRLKPKLGATEVGARLLRLAAGASLRPHSGPGGRLVAHLGVLVPDGATITVGGEARAWEEGGLLLFDDEVEHSSANAHPSRARVVLHVTFPKPGVPSAAVATIVSGDGDFKVTVFANCSAQATFALH